MDTVTIEGDTVRAVSPEGKTASMPLKDLFRTANRRRMDSRGVILPEGIRLLDSSGPLTIWVHETPPCIHNLKWIAADSPARHGPETKYRQVAVALPYLIIMAMFEGNRISGSNECFFRTAPLGDEDDELFYPALLNCSKFTPQDRRPLSWICTAKMGSKSFVRSGEQKTTMRRGFDALRRCLLETGFNYSSEDNEGSSWFTESTHVDPRIATIENWVEATKKDPMFVLGVPWLKTGMSVRQVVDRMFAIRGLRGNNEISASDVTRMVFNYCPQQPE